jgi:thiol:disulfide interchange protein
MRQIRFVVFAAIAAMFVGANNTSAQQASDPFDAQFESPRKSQPVKLPAVLPDPTPEDGSKLSPGAKKIREFVQMTASVLPEQARRGEVVRVSIHVTTKPWAYTYSAVKRHATQRTVSTTIRYKDAPWLSPLYPIKETGTEEYSADDETQYILHGDFTWIQEVYISPNAPIGRQVFWVQPHLQVCTKQNKEPKISGMCYPATEFRPLQVVLTILDGPPASPPDELEPRKKAIDLKVPPTDGITPQKPGTDAQRFEGLGALLLAAFVGAILMLLTPCVFPMIPITVNFFIKQSEKEHHRPFVMASVYAGTIVVLLTLVVMLVGKSVIDLANDAWFNLGLGMVLILFALGLFGMFDVGLSMFFGTVILVGVGYGLSRLAKFALPALTEGNYEFALAVGSMILAIPVTYGFAHTLRFVERLFGFEESAVLGFFAKQESRGGMIGAAFMAMTFTITSFSCTGPFLGILLAPLAGTNMPKLHLLAGALVYSATFAAPFFLLALFPTFLKKLPRSGGWMTTIKVTMGFLEIGAALKFLSNADLFWFPGNPRIFNYDTVLVSWIALSFACSMYLFGVFRLHHDTPEDHIGVPRMIFASIFLGMALYLTPLLFGIVPRGIVMEAAVSFLPPDFDRPGEKQKGNAHGGIDWIEHNYEDAWKKAIAEKKLIFVDFTGQNCPVCRINERNVFPLPAVVQELKNYVCVKLYTDNVPNPKLTPNQALLEAEINKARQIKLIDDIAQPSYVILDPSRVQPFKSNDAIDATVVGVVTGQINNTSDFERFLRAPLAVRKIDEERAGWHRDFSVARNQAVRERKRVFVQFYGIGDVSSRLDDRDVLTTQKANDALDGFVRVKLPTDIIIEEHLTLDERRKGAQANARLQVELLHDFSSPAYLILDPNLLREPGAKMSDCVVAAQMGPWHNLENFLMFLRRARC